MTRTITALTLQKRDGNRLNVFLDDTYAFSLDLNVALGLTRGQSLSATDIERLQCADEAHRAYQYALRLLGYRPRSQTEVERRLRQKGYAAQAIDAALKRLLANQHLDDAAFAHAWVEHREHSRPRGARALRYELRQKGIDTNIIDRVVTELDEEASAWAAITRKLERWRGLEQREFLKRATGFLNRRGFGYGTIRTISRKAWETLSQCE